MRKMKLFAVALLVLLLIAVALGLPTPENHGCCYPDYENFNCSGMKDYYETNTNCPHSGIMFRTTENQFICADSKEESVQMCLVSMVLKNRMTHALKKLQPWGLDWILKFRGYG